MDGKEPHMKCEEENTFKPIAEGGSCRRIYTAMPDQPRPAATAIEYRLPAGGRSAPHSLDADELWFHLGGGEVEIVRSEQDGNLSRIRLRPGGHCLLPAGCVFGARELSGQEAHFGCVVVPGYEDAGLQLYTARQLLQRFPGSWAIWADFMPAYTYETDDR